MNVETIVLKELGIGYPSKNGVRVVAEHINGAIRSGELTCLLGANGVGKVCRAERSLRCLTRN